MDYKWSKLGIITLGAGFGIGITITLSLVTVNKILQYTKKKKITRIIDAITEKYPSTVYIRDLDEVEHKVCELIKGRATKVQVICNFEYCLLNSQCQGRACNSNHSLSRSLPTFQNKLMGDQAPCALELFLKAHHLDDPAREIEMTRIASALGSAFRRGCSTMITMLDKHKIPLFVTSNSQPELISEMLKLNACSSSSVAFVNTNKKKHDNSPSSGLTFDEMIEQCQDETKPNLIVVSTTLPPLAMPQSKCVLTIGILDSESVEMLNSYKAAFDIVLWGNPPLDVVSSLIQKIV